MGRHSIGEQAMSGAERTRRYREKLRHSQPVTKKAQPAKLIHFTLTHCTGSYIPALN